MPLDNDPQVAAIEGVCRRMEEDPTKEWSLDLLIQETGIPKSTFLMLFRQQVGDTPMAFLRDRRMQLACKLLEDGRTSIASVAEQVGYQSVSAFGASFKKWSGRSPSVYRRDELKVIRLKFPDRFSDHRGHDPGH